jgi:hypothetical protein
MQKCSNSRGFRFSAGKRTSAHRGDEAPEERLNRSELVYSVDRSRAEKLRALAWKRRPSRPRRYSLDRTQAEPVLTGRRSL